MEPSSHRVVDAVTLCARRVLWSALACVTILSAADAHGQNQCRLYLAEHWDGVSSGATLSLETRADTNGLCQLSSVRLILTVGDGSMLHTQRVSFTWQTGVVYTASAILTAAGPQQLFLNGQLEGSLSNSFQPAQAGLSGSLVDDAGIAIENYILRQTSLQISNGTNLLNLEPNGGNPVPLPLVLLPGGPAPWNTAFAEDATQTTTITATFRFDPLISDPHQFDPYIDTYGQAIQANWPAKIQSDTQLQATALQEQSCSMSTHPFLVWTSLAAPLSPAGATRSRATITPPNTTGVGT